MTWKLWLDDQINDPNTPTRWAPADWIGASSNNEAILLVMRLGIPSEIDLDHDLGLDDNDNPIEVKVFLRWLLEQHYQEIDGVSRLLPPPKWSVHSANPVGAIWISDFMTSWNQATI